MDIHELTNYDVKEVSLVNEGAIQENFLILKRGNCSMKKLLEKIAKMEIPAEEIKALVEKYKLTDEQKELLKAHMAIAKAGDSEPVLKAFGEVSGIVKEDAKVDDVVDDDKKVDGDDDDKSDDDKDKGDADSGDKKDEAEVQKALKDKEKVEKELNDLKDKNLKTEFVEKAKGYKNAGLETGKLADLLIEVSKKMDAKAYKAIENMLKGYEAALEKSELFKTKGKDGEGDIGDAKESVRKMALERAEKKKISYETAYTEIVKENPDLYEKLQG